VNKPIVMIVDDDTEIRVGLRYYLEARGFHVVVAMDGQQGLKEFRESPKPPQVVVLDLRMPNQGGLSFLHELKKEKVPPKVIVVTGLTGDTVEQAVEGYGAAKLLAKPVPLSVVEGAIREVLGKERLLRPPEAASQ